MLLLLLLLLTMLLLVVVVLDGGCVATSHRGLILYYYLLFLQKKTPQTHMPSTSMNPEPSWSISLNTRWYSANDRDLMLSSCCSVTTYSAFRNKYLVA